MLLDFFDGAEATPARGAPLLSLRLSAVNDRPPDEIRTNVDSTAASPEALSGGIQPRRRTRVYFAIGIAIVAVMLVAAYALTGGFHHASSSSSGSGVVLIPYGTGYSFPIGQFSGIEFTIGSSSNIEGTLNSTEGIAIYIFTPTQYEELVRTLVVPGYVWTSGVVAVQELYTFHIQVSPGQWWLAFVNTNPNFPTGVGFYSDVTLTPT